MRINNVQLCGRIASDISFTPSAGDKKAARMYFRLAVNRPKSENSDFIPCVVWGKYAEAIVEYVEKGKQVAVRGSIHTNAPKQEDGSYKNFFEVRVEEISLGQSSAKVQREKKAGSRDMAALADQLTASAGQPSQAEQLAALVAELLKRGVKPAEAATMAEKALLGERSEENEDEAQDPFSATA